MLSKDYEQILVSEEVPSIPAYTAGDGLVFIVPLSENSAYPLYTPERFYGYGPYTYTTATWPDAEKYYRGALPAGSILWLIYGSVSSATIYTSQGPVTITFNPALLTGNITLAGYTVPQQTIDPRIYTNQEFQSWARPLVASGYQPVPYWGTAVEFPDEDTAPNGYPLVDHDGPIRGRFSIPSTTGMQVVECDFYRDAPQRNWRPRAVPTIAGLYFSTYMGAMLFRGSFSRDRIPAIPAKYRSDPQIGWNAGAVSLDDFDGDLHVTFQSSIAVGGAVGFLTSARAAELDDAGDPPQLADLLFAWYFDTDGNADPRARIMENGKIVATLGGYDPGEDGTTFEIRRVRGRMSYWTQDGVDAPVEVYVSKRTGSGDWNVGSALYAGGDTIP